MGKFENEDWPSKPALEYKVPVGTLACPHCGAVINGAVYEPICQFCGKLYWGKIKWRENKDGKDIHKYN